MTTKATNLAAAIFLSLQLCLVVHAQFTPYRYFCWAPNDYANTYSLNVKIEGEELTPDQALTRYHLQDHRASYENPATHIMDTVRQYEETYGRDDHAEVVLRWSLNGHPLQTWCWPGERSNVATRR
jgi:hypothetical protein